MQGFHEVEETEEFDWFFENAKEQEITDYSSITDLKQENMDDNSIADMKREIPHKEILRNDSFTCGDIEEDGKMWKYSEGLYEAMRDVFCAVFEKLCGYGIQEVSKSISGSIEQLEKKCEVVWSGIFYEDSMRTVEDGQEWHPEAAARIESCLSQNGCVIAMVSDEQWRRIKGEEDLPFADSGVRSLHVIGLKGGDVIVNDFADKKGCCFHVPLQQFSGLHGILAEVYK